MNVEDVINNACADLLAEERNESFVRGLLRRQRGEWVRVEELCREAGVATPPREGAGKDLVVTWLDEPTGMAGFAWLVFYSPSEGWSMTATYNSARLLLGDRSARV